MSRSVTFYLDHGVSVVIETLSQDEPREYAIGDGSIIEANFSGTSTLRLTGGGETATVEVTCDDVREDYRIANPGFALPSGLITHHCEIAASDWKNARRSARR